MPEPPDIIAQQADAMKGALDQHVELRRMARDELVNRPIIGKEMSAEEQTQHYLSFRDDQIAVGSSFDELSARFQLPVEKPIPRRLVRYLIRGEQRLNRRKGAD